MDKTRWLNSSKGNDYPTATVTEDILTRWWRGGGGLAEGEVGDAQTASLS